MLPEWLNFGLIFIVSILAPCVCSLYSLGHADKEGIRRWLAYFTLYAVLSVILPLIEPFILAVLSMLPVTFYLEVKLAMFFCLVCPRFGLLDKIESRVETFVETTGKRWYICLEEKLKHARESVGSLLVANSKLSTGTSKNY